MTIKETANLLHIKEHVLRYWEEELGLEIKRNEMGYREYGDRDIEMFKKIQNLRSQGVGLKEIRDGITAARENAKPDERTTESTAQGDTTLGNTSTGDACGQTEIANAASLPDEIKVVDFKTAQLQSLMNKIVANAFHENRDILVSSIMDELVNKNKKIITSSLRGELTEDVMKQIDIILKEQEERDEARFRKLDETIRNLQDARLEVAAARNKKRLFKR
jgi:DNA-binding transcriptional MerR regulator